MLGEPFLFTGAKLVLPEPTKKGVDPTKKGKKKGG
jgi:hypothetical protein